MKKAVKGLIVAATVAAVVGVGAVSYAAWSGGTNTTQAVGGATGQINTIGNITVSPKTASGESLTSLKKLCPVDQDDDKVPSDCVKYWAFDLSTTVTGTQSVKYTILGSLTAGAGNAATPLGSAALKWSTTVPSAAADGTAVSGTAADITATNNEATVYVFLTASNTDAMNATISLTFGVANAA